MELWRGYFQSIRPSENQMYINIDIATGIMYKSGPLIELFMEFFKQKDPAAFSPRRGLPDRERLRLQKFISNMRVVTTHTGRERAVVVRKLSNSGASTTMFKMRDSDKSISVADYFKKHANITLKFPDNICIEVYLIFRFCFLILISIFSLDSDWSIDPYRIMPRLAWSNHAEADPCG